MTNQYETVFIMTPVLSDDQLGETVKKYKEILTGGGDEIVSEENWKLRKLAYPIQKKSTGFYYSLEYKGSGKAISELEIAFRRDERILRFLTVKLDKHAIAYSVKRKNKLKGMREETARRKPQYKEKREVVVNKESEKREETKANVITN